MMMNKINLNVVTHACSGSKTAGASVILVTLFVITLLLSMIAQADGLFDFQMKMAEKGNAEAEYKVGEMYETGFGVNKDMKAAKSWIIKSANQGHETASFKLLYWDMQKNGITAANKAQVETLQLKAKEGNPQAQYYVGKMHANGVGVTKNNNKAISWLNKAALYGVLAAESEMILVREEKQRQQLNNRRANEKKRNELKAKQESERQARLKEQNKLQSDAEAQSSKELSIKQKAEADARAKAKADQLAADEEKKATLLAKHEADKKREAQKQALLKKREADNKKRKVQFESDPCSGKSARFLSTCK